MCVIILIQEKTSWNGEIFGNKLAHPLEPDTHNEANAMYFDFRN